MLQTLVGTGTLLRLGWPCSSGVKLMGFEELLHLKVGAGPRETQSEFLLLSFSFPTRDQIHPLAVEHRS